MDSVDRRVHRSNFMRGEESPGSTRKRQLLTATKGNLRESATETIPFSLRAGTGEKSGVTAHSWLW
jgi:hypothetical protein